MGQMLQNDGAFRGKVLDHAVGQTKNGFPQWVVRLGVSEYYDEAEQQWVDWSEHDLVISGYMILFGGEGPCMVVEQGALQRATGWSGESFVELDSLDLSETVVLFRTQWDNYDGKDRLKVVWVDEKDASPTRELRKLDSSQLSALDAKFGLKKPPTAAKAPAKAAAPQPSEPKKAGSKPKKAEAELPARPNPESESKPGDRAWGDEECSAQDAWSAVHEYTPEAEDSRRNEAWLKYVTNIVGNTADDAITPAQWAQIRDAILNSRELPTIPF